MAPGVAIKSTTSQGYQIKLILLSGLFRWVSHAPHALLLLLEVNHIENGDDDMMMMMM
jgi:hypothetical protein